MQYDKLFRFLFVHQELHDETVTGRLLRGIVRAIEERGYTVVTALSTDQAQEIVRNDASIACALVDWDVRDDRCDTNEFIRFIRHRGLEIPIFLVTERHSLADMPGELIESVCGFIYPQEDTPGFTAKVVLRAYEKYVGGLKTPFFGGMIDYVESGNQMWLAPGHNGGIFYQKSPVGRIFFDYLGENFWRADFNFVPDLGDIFGPTGPFRDAEAEAAKIFGAERTYFVLNGSSTSNKMVTGSLVSPGDLVMLDRNNHKSIVHGALVLAGGIPVYLDDDRNSFGMVGPVGIDALDEQRIREQIRDNPLVKDPNRWQSERPFRLAVIENCTYDGTIYDVKRVLERIGRLCDYVLFDEAWGGFMRFHPIYRGRYGMGLDNLGPDSPGVLTVQSTHKQLAGMSQASQFHVKDSHIEGQRRKVNHRRINEVFMMHTSTSPFYPMYASLDVGAQMMKGRSGEFLWDEALRMGIDIRKQIRNMAKRYRETESDPRRQWFFDPFVPWTVNTEGHGDHPPMSNTPWEDVPTDVLVNDPQCWMFHEGDAWHGYTRIEKDYAMVDPTKMLLLTPGIDRKKKEYEEWGISGSILGRFMRSRGIVPEKTDFNLILFLLTPGLEFSKAGSLLAALVEFKRLFDDNAPVGDVLPGLPKEYPGRYDGRGIQEVAQGLHDLLRKYDAKRLQREIFQREFLPEIAMTPQDAHNALVSNRVDYVPLDEVEGRVSATLALVYPPGVGVVVQGERYTERSRPVVDYFRLFEETENRFPGFENEIQGVYSERQTDGSVRYFTYVVQE